MTDNIEISPIYNRLHLTNNQEFTIPETASLFCSGGGIFRNGIAIGNNNSNIPGSIRFNNNKLEYLKNEEWANLLEFNNSNIPANSSDTGNKGDVTYDNDYLYICVDKNKWKRFLLEEW